MLQSVDNLFSEVTPDSEGFHAEKVVGEAEKEQKTFERDQKDFLKQELHREQQNYSSIDVFAN